MQVIYSYAFGSYASILILGYENHLLEKFLTTGVIFFFTFLNVLGAYISGKAEDLMVFAKLSILIFFFNLWLLDSRLDKVISWKLGKCTWNTNRWAYDFPRLRRIWTDCKQNTAQDIKDTEKNLPKAYYLSVITVILGYVVIAIVAVGNLDIKDIQKYSDYALYQNWYKII